MGLLFTSLSTSLASGPRPTSAELPAVFADGLVKRFGKTEALRGLDLRADQGTVLGVLGPNGAGKTTAVRILATLLPADAYSGGMRRRLDVAASLTTAPPLLVLDEPTTGLDPRARIGVWEMLTELVRDGVTVLLTSQYLDGTGSRSSMWPGRRGGDARRAEGPGRQRLAGRHAPRDEPRRRPRHRRRGADQVRQRCLFRDGFLVAQRNLAHAPRVPELLASATIQPVMFVALFASAGTATALAADMSNGLVDRFRALPMTRSVVLFGRAFSDLDMNAITVVGIAAAGLAVGWRANGGLAAAAAGFALLLFGFAMSWVGALLGLVMRTPEVVQTAMLGLLFPVIFLSNALVPTNGRPRWLQVVADWNPVSAISSALRELFGNPNPYVAEGVWPAQHPVLASLLWVVANLAAFGPLAV